MNVCVARKIDLLIGVPICFFLSFFERLRKFFPQKKSIKVVPKRILFLELSEIGSAILSYPAIEKVKKEYPKAAVYFWIFKENSQILYLLNSIPQDNIFIMRSRNIFVLLIDVFRNLRRIKKENIDTIIDMELFSRFSTILSYLSGAKIRVGFCKGKTKGPYRGNLHTRKVIYNPSLHMSRNFEFLVNSLELSSKDIPLIEKLQNTNTFELPKILSSDTEREKIIHKLQAINSSISRESKIVIMHVGFKDKIYIRRWPVEHYLELIQLVLQDKNVFIVLIGLKSTDRKTRLFKHQRCLNLIGKTTIKELLALFSISGVLISHDSGIVHVASLTDINIVVLFGPETPVLYTPLTSNKTVLYSSLDCSPCISAYNNRRSSCKNNKCLEMITVDQVYEAARKYI